MHGTGTGGASAALLRRQALAGKSGLAGLVHNRRIFGLAVFASLGGLYGVFSSVLKSDDFESTIQRETLTCTHTGWFVAILELGAWFGVLLTGPLADYISRKYTILVAVVVFVVGVIVQTTAQEPSSIYGGRFIVGLGVGSLSMTVPMYNAEMSPPEVRGSLVALQQMAIVTGIMISFWIDYCTNFIGGTGDGQSEAAWRLPLALQLVPALILGAGVMFMPFSPRWLVNQGRDDEALVVLSNARRLDPQSDLVQIEYLEIRAQHLFEKEVEEERFPPYQADHTASPFKRRLGAFSHGFKSGSHGYLSLVTNKVLFRRVAVGALTMFFQQWTGEGSCKALYYAPRYVQHCGTGNTISLLATGVVGVAMFLTTIPAVIWVDQLGRKPILISGAFIMAGCHFIVAALIGQFSSDWPAHKAAGWVACAFVWIFAMAFGYSWGPAAWIIIAEVFPLSVRGKGMSIAASSNWMNNFIGDLKVTPSMLSAMPFGTFIFFGLFSFLGGIFIWFFVPETKGLTLEEMDAAFGDADVGLARADLERQAAINKRIGLDAYNHPHDPEEKGAHATDEKHEIVHANE
ncbi:general substrate transporter [Exidia glandulosa HHB12029]|uniref:General substrate transporter n=1 Tax=Exidia glandulosa HHB12029 TaxID=1314781 RepID=A0A165NJR6_EXIGL|nr:general substrate transporter [Exidia glandulosa HHB12029]